MYGIYIKHDDRMLVISIESNVYQTESELLADGYIKINEGENAEIYAFPLRYLLSKHRKPLYDADYHPNFKFENGKILALTKAEKESLFPAVQSEPTEIDRLADRITKLESVVNLFKKEK